MRQSLSKILAQTRALLSSHRVQHSNLVLTALAYQITGSLSLQCVATGWVMFVW